MGKKLFPLLLILLFIACSEKKVYSSYKITLEESFYTDVPGNIVKLYVAEDHSFLKNIPQIKCDLSAINYFKKDKFVYSDSIPNQIYLFVGVNEKKKEKYVIVDANDNHDFSDDELFIVPITDVPLSREDKKDKFVQLKVIYDHINNGVGHIAIDPYNYFQIKNDISQDDDLQVVIGLVDYMEASAQIDAIAVEINSNVSSNLYDRKLNDKTNFRIRFRDKNGEEDSRYLSRGDTINILDKVLVLSEVNYPDITLEQIAVFVDSSGVGSYMPIVYSRDLGADEKIKINDKIKGKYVFIKFWGSWSGPSIVSIRELKELYEKIKNREDVLVLGIALEEDYEGVEKLKRIINNEKIEWDNYWFSIEDGKLSKSIQKKLNLKDFPTYLIINERGKIVYRTQSMYRTHEAVDFFLNMIDE